MNSFSLLWHRLHGSTARKFGLLVCFALPFLPTRTFAQASTPGRIEVSPPPAGHAWTLPPPGDPATPCPGGDARAILWAPDARSIVAEVDTGNAVVLCFYDLSAFSFAPSAAHRVQVSRVSASPSALPPSSATERALQSFGTKNRDFLFTEAEPRFSPPVGATQRLAFVTTQGDKPPRAIGLENARLSPPAWKYRPLDGLPFSASSSSSTFQLAWSPLMPQPQLVLVSNLELACGKARLVLYSLRPDGSVDPSSRRALSSPCAAGTPPLEANVADRDPAWDFSPHADRVAFIRSDRSNGQNRLCLLKNASSPRSAADCNLLAQDDHPVSRAYPIFSSNGRFLLYNATHAFTHARQEPATIERLEYIDFQNISPKARVAGKDLGDDQKSLVRLNPYQSPPCICSSDGVHCWTFVIAKNAEGLHDRILALPLGEDGSTSTRTEISTGLRNIKAVQVARGVQGQVILAAIAQSSSLEGRSSRDSVSILLLDSSSWK